MKILVYHWKAYNYIDIMETFCQMGHTVKLLKYHIEHYDDDAVFARGLEQELDAESFDFVFSVNYFAVISEVCQPRNMKYVSWSCDNPLISMYHRAVYYPCNYIFTFDKTNYYEFRQMGVEHIWYLPLTANVNRIDLVLRQLDCPGAGGALEGAGGTGAETAETPGNHGGTGEETWEMPEDAGGTGTETVETPGNHSGTGAGTVETPGNHGGTGVGTWEMPEGAGGTGAPSGGVLDDVAAAALENGREIPRYIHDVTFVGSLYERNFYDKIEGKLPDYLRGYMDGIIRAQLNVSGGNLVERMLTPDILAQMETYFELEKSEYSFSNLGLVFGVTALGFKIAAQQRTELLNLLSKKHRVSVYSNSNLAGLPLCESCGSVDYWTKLPWVFRKSKINLNFTLPNIKSGLPLRIWDVLASGGFLITNYQAEIPDFFVPGEDLVVFESPQELEDAVSYYLEHGEERERIARNGRRKVEQFHSYPERLGRMLSIVFGDE